MPKIDDLPMGIVYEKAMRLTRTLAIALFASLCLNLGLAASLIILTPLKEIKPYFVPIAEQGTTHYYKIIPAEGLSTNQQLELIRNYLKVYVVDRHTIDDVTETIRFKKIVAQSDEKVFADFKNQYHLLKEKMPNVKRRIEIVRDQILDPYFHQVEFRTIDTNAEGREVKNLWVVNMRYTLAGINAPAIKIAADEMENNPNPLGIKITNYDFVQKRGNE